MMLCCLDQPKFVVGFWLPLHLCCKWKANHPAPIWISQIQVLIWHLLPFWAKFLAFLLQDTSWMHQLPSSWFQFLFLIFSISAFFYLFKWIPYYCDHIGNCNLLSNWEKPPSNRYSNCLQYFIFNLLLIINIFLLLHNFNHKVKHTHYPIWSFCIFVNTMSILFPFLPIAAVLFPAVA